MPSLDLYRRQISSLGSTVGSSLKRSSDMIMESTWDNDIQSRVCYIYDYFHDDDPDAVSGFDYTNTNKHKIDAKFIVTQYSTLSKGQVEYHLMFRPSQALSFTQWDDLYYFEEDYRNRFSMTWPIGMYVDIPDERGVYKRWLICAKEIGNQFEKYSILPCDYKFQWVDRFDGKKVKREMWGCLRGMNSYTAGLWIDYNFYALDDVGSIWLPLNSVTQNVGYLTTSGKSNQRVCVSAKIDTPMTYKISKVGVAQPVGLIKLTLDQDSFNQYTDYIERDEYGNIIGMWADYYYDDTKPSQPLEDAGIVGNMLVNLTAPNSRLRVGGSYKTITASIIDNGVDVTAEHMMDIGNWRVYLGKDLVDITDSSLIILMSPPDKPNVAKIKFANDRSYINKIITVRCTVDNIVGEIQLDLTG